VHVRRTAFYTTNGGDIQVPNGNFSLQQRTAGHLVVGPDPVRSGRDARQLAIKYTRAKPAARPRISVPRADAHRP
jgi:hypothetical protein